MQIMIDIDEDMYKWAISSNITNGDYGAGDFIDLVKNGTVLEPHGRCIDADALLKSHLTSDYDCRITRSGVESAPTILEATKGNNG